ncbi:MAG: nuclear transport factor 2 family protein [Candidatus Kapaibacterium sp.]|jgi:hypothetical protein
MKIKLIILALLFPLFLTSCGGDGSGGEHDLLTDEQRKKEVEMITDVIKAYNKANNDRNWAGMVQTLDKEVTFFGSDKGEMSKDMAAFKETIKNQWENYTVMEYGEIQDIYVELDDYATLANIIFGVPLKVVSKEGVSEDLFVIIQRTLKKDPVDKKWVIRSGILYIPRVVSN